MIVSISFKRADLRIFWKQALLNFKRDHSILNSGKGIGEVESKHDGERDEGDEIDSTSIIGRERYDFYVRSNHKTNTGITKTLMDGS